MSDVMFYVNVGGHTIGPASEQQVIDAIRTGKIPRGADICRVGESEWRYVHEMEPFAREFAMGVTPAPPPPPRRASAGGLRWSSLGPIGKVVVVALGGIAVLTMLGVGLAFREIVRRRVADADSVVGSVPEPAARRPVAELIVGAWVRPGLAPEVYAADGTLRIGTDPPGTYQITGTPDAATLVTVSRSGVRTWDVTFPDDDTMTCNSLVYRRAGAAGEAPASVAVADEASTLIVGTWRAAGLTETFTESGGYSLNGARGEYAIAGSRERAVLRTRTLGGAWRSWLVSFVSDDTMAVGPPDGSGGLLYHRVR